MHRNHSNGRAFVINLSSRETCFCRAADGVGEVDLDTGFPGIAGSAAKFFSSINLSSLIPIASSQ